MNPTSPTSEIPTESAPPLSGSLSQLSVPELLQTAEAARRSGTVSLRARGRRATLWLRAGRVVDAEIDDGLRGREAVYDAVLWTAGTFEADFTPVAVAERISESTSFLLLEAMRRHDESRREREPPPHAAIPDPPPPPPRPLMALHRALTLVAVTASYASEHLTPELVEARLEEARSALAGERPALRRFRIGEAGAPFLDGAPEPDGGGIDAEALVAAVAAWLQRFFERAEAALPGRFPLAKLRRITEAVSDDVAELGFYDALGLESPDEEDAA